MQALLLGLCHLALTALLLTLHLALHLARNPIACCVCSALAGCLPSVYWLISDSCLD